MATKKPVTPVTPAPTVINLAAARKKRKLSGQDRKDAVEFARSMVGYNDTSPIWGKKLIVVLAELSEQLDEVEKALGSDSTIVEARTTVSELQKRVAFGQIMKAQS
jgi:hypothetical protein